VIWRVVCPEHVWLVQWTTRVCSQDCILRNQLVRASMRLTCNPSLLSFPSLSIRMIFTSLEDLWDRIACQNCIQLQASNPNLATLAERILSSGPYLRSVRSKTPRDTTRTPKTSNPNKLPSHVSICANNCTYVNAIGTVGNYHIGIYTRLLLMFLVDPLARPSESWMKKWIDMTQSSADRSVSISSRTRKWCIGSTLWWLRWEWALFVLSGVGSVLRMEVEDAVRNGLGMKKRAYGWCAGAGRWFDEFMMALEAGLMRDDSWVWNSWGHEQWSLVRWEV